MKSIITKLSICFFVCSFHSCFILTHKSHNKQSVKLYTADTISLDTTNFVDYDFIVENLSDSNLLIKEFLTCGYSKDDRNDFYIEMYKIDGNKKRRTHEHFGHYPHTEYLGEYALLKKGEHRKFSDITTLNPFRESGIYVFRVVFCNKYSFIGKSNWVSIVCIGKRR